MIRLFLTLILYVGQGCPDPNETKPAKPAVTAEKGCSHDR